MAGDCSFLPFGLTYQDFTVCLHGADPHLSAHRQGHQSDSWSRWPVLCVWGRSGMLVSVQEHCPKKAFLLKKIDY